MIFVNPILAGRRALLRQDHTPGHTAAHRLGASLPQARSWPLSVVPWGMSRQSALVGDVTDRDGPRQQHRRRPGRRPGSPGNPGPTPHPRLRPRRPAVILHLLASLHHQIQADLPTAVARARDHNLSWAEIGDLLATTRAAACNRYRPPAHPTSTTHTDRPPHTLTKPVLLRTPDVLSASHIPTGQGLSHLKITRQTTPLLADRGQTATPTAFLAAISQAVEQCFALVRGKRGAHDPP